MKKLLLALSLIFATCGLFAQTPVAKKSTNKKTTVLKKKKVSTRIKKSSASFACPMHPEIKENKPGKCSKCGMDLKNENYKNKGEAHNHAYYCPMKCEGEKTYEKEGKCPKCKMDLVKKE